MAQTDELRSAQDVLGRGSRYEAMTGSLRAPLVAVTAVVLLAVATGILQGYASLARQTIEARGMEDFGLFYASARQHLNHDSLYGPLLKPGTRQASDARNLNPPYVNLVFLPFAALPARLALLGWFLLNLCALGDSARIAAREGIWKPLSLGGLAAGVFLLAWAPMAALVITAQLALLVMWLVTRAWWAARRGDWRRAGLWIGTAAAAKLFLLLFIPYLVLRRQWGALGAAVLQIVTLVAAGALVFGPDAYLAWWRQFGEVTWQGHYMNASWWGVLERALHGSTVYRKLWSASWFVPVAWAVGASLVLALTCVRLARAGTRDVDFSFALLIAAALLASPLGWVYYFWLGVVPLGAWVRSTRPLSAGTLLMALVLATAALWHASATIWLQPSGLATITVGSVYFWALFGTWAWLMTLHVEATRADSAHERAAAPAELQVAASVPSTPSVTGT
jgi:glycosyl transferase family 87